MPSNTEHVGIIVDINTGKNGLLDSAKQIKNAFRNVKLPEDVGRKLTKSFENVERAVSKANKAMASGDSKAIAKYTKEAEHAMKDYMQEAEKAGKHIKFENFKFVDDKAYTDAKQKLADLKKLREEVFRQRSGDSKNTFIQTASDLQDALQNKVGTKGAKTAAGNVQSMIDAAAAGDFAKVETHYKEVTDYVDKFGKKLAEAKQEALGLGSETGLFENFKRGYEDATKSAANFNTQIEEQENIVNNMRMDQLNKTIEDLYNNLNLADGALDRFGDDSHGAEKAAKDIERLNRNLDSIRSRVENFFGLDRVFDIARRMAQQAFQTVEALDKSMTETAVVTNFRVGDMWEKLPEYTQTANELGSTIKDVYDASTLYYQQGLGTQATMELSVETLKMARIAGMDAAQATDMMTAALRGFNMELNQTDAQRVNDVYSKLAAITAANTQEISTAMTKVASLAHSAGMEFETTSAFLSQIIETTREAPETAGTALKTVVARFGEIKQLMSTDQLVGEDEEGEKIYVNKIDKALEAAGLSLKQFAAGQEGLDDVLLRLAEKWDTLDTATQRYIATMAAGSRQQSRFLALMSDYDRTMELVDAAYNSNGASQKQFEKTLESLESMMNKLKNAWNEFTMGILNNTAIKSGIDGLTKMLELGNKLVELIAKLVAPKGLEGLAKSIISAAAAWGLFTKGGGAITNIVTQASAKLTAKKNSYLDENGKYVGPDRAPRVALRGGLIDPTAELSYANFRPVGLQFNRREKEPFNRKSFRDILGHYRGQEGLQPALDIKQFKQLSNGAGNLLGSAAGVNEDDARIAFENTINELRGVAPIIADKLEEYATLIKEEKAKLNEGDTEGASEIEGKASEILQEIRKGPVGGKLPGASGQLQMASKNMRAFGNSLQYAGAQLSMMSPLLAPIGTGLQVIGAVSGLVATAFTGLSIAIPFLQVGFLKLAGAETLEAVKATEAALATAGFEVTLAPLAVTIAAVVAALLPLVAAIAAVAIAYDALTVSQKEAESHAGAGAAAAQEAANNANSAYEEMSNALAHIKENEDAFDGLTAGTAKWEEQLVKNNQEILDLIKNYSELQQYVTTRGDGRLELSSEGQAKARDLASDNVKRSTAIQTLQNLEQQRLEFDRKIQKEQNANQRELLQRQKESVTRMSTETAFRQLSQTSGLDLKNREAIANYGASRYGSPEYVQNLRLGKAEEQEVLDFYGYTKVGKNKYQDNTGKEVAIDKEAMKSLYATIQQADVFQANAQQWDDIITELNSTFQDVASKQEGLQDTKGLGQAFSKILTQNGVVDGDLLKEVATNGTIVDDFVTGIEQSQRDFIAGHENATVDEVRQILQENAEAMRQLDLDRTTDIASMMTAYNSQASQTADEATKAVFDKSYKAVDKLSAEQRKSLADNLEKIGDSQWGEGGAIYANFAVQAEQLGGKTAVAFNEAFGADFDPTSAISSARAVSLLQNSGTKLGKQAGKALETALGDQIGLAAQTKEVLASGDYNDAVNELMKDLGDGAALSSADINKLAGSSQTLRRYLDQTNMSLSTFANIANSGDFSKLNDAVLTLAQNFGKVDAIAEQAHSTIENFSAGIDTGEADDFMKDNAGKALDYIKGGEWGNQELQSILSQTFSDYQKIFKQYHGNLEKVGKYYKGRIKDLSVDEDSIPKYLAARTKKLDKLLKGTGAEYTTKSGLLEITKIGKLTTDQLQNILRKAGNLTPQMAEVVMESMLNRSGTLGRDLKRNDYQESFTTYRKEKAVGGQAFITGTTAGLTAPMAGKSKQDVRQRAEAKGITYVETRKAAQDEKRFGELGLVNALNQIGSKYSGIDSADINKNIKTIAEKATAVTDKGIAAPKMMQALSKMGFTQEQQLRSMQQALKSGETLTDDRGRVLTDESGKALGPDATTKDIADAIARFNDNAKWYDVGKQIAEGYIAVMRGEEPTGNNGNTGGNTGGSGDSGGSTGGESSSTTKVGTKKTTKKVEEEEESSEPKTKRITGQVVTRDTTFKKQSAYEQYNNKTDVQSIKQEQKQEQDNKRVAKEQEQARQNLKRAKARAKYHSFDDEAAQQNKEEADRRRRDRRNAANSVAEKTATQLEKDRQKRLSDRDKNYQTRMANLNATDTRTASANYDKVPDAIKKKIEDPNTYDFGKTQIDMSKAIDQGLKNNKKFVKGKKSLTDLIADKLGLGGGAGGKGGEGKGTKGMFGAAGKTTNSGLGYGGIPGQPGSNIPGQGFTTPTFTPKTPKGTKTTNEVTNVTKNITKEVTETEVVVNSASLQKAKEQLDALKVPIQIKLTTGKAVSAAIASIKNRLKKAKTNVKVGADTKSINSKLDATYKKIKRLPNKKELKLSLSVSNTGPLDEAIRKWNSISSGTKTLKLKIEPTLSKNTITLSASGKKATLAVAAAGMNNELPSTKLPGLGSAAKGVQGTLGPRGKGGKTLVGELGPELAWLPGEGKSVLLGKNGPQVVDLPKDAVVYTNEQTKKILSDKVVKNLGSLAAGYKKTVKLSSTDKAQARYDAASVQVEITQSQYDALAANKNTYLSQLLKSLDKQLKAVNKQIPAAYKVLKTREQQYKKLRSTTAKVDIDVPYASKKKTKTKKKSVDIKGFIAGNVEDGYTINQAKIESAAKKQYDKLVKAGVNKKDANKAAKAYAKQLQEQVNSRIEKVSSAYQSAASNYYNAKKAKEDLKQQIEDLKKYENQYDRIWRLQQKMSGYEDKRNRLAKQYTRILDEQVYGHEKLFKLIRDQQNTYNSAQNDNADIIDEALRQINELRFTRLNGKVNFSDLFGIDFENLTITSRMKGDSLKTDLLKNAGYDMTDDQISLMNDIESKIESLLGNIRTARDAFEDNRTALKELMETGLQETRTLEDQILNAIKTIRQRTIDNLNTLNDTINKTLNNLTDQVSKHLDKIRQDNENAKTEQSLLDKQQRLAMLQMDTGNGNAVEIAALQKEIAEDQQSYLESLQDQSLQHIQNQNEEAANQREKQIELLTKQLDYQEKTGQLAAETNAMMQMVSTSDGQQAIKDLLDSADGVGTMPYYATREWLSTLTTNINQAQVQKDIQDNKVEDIPSMYTAAEWLMKLAQNELALGGGQETRISRENMTNMRRAGLSLTELLEEAGGLKIDAKGNKTMLDGGFLKRVVQGDTSVQEEAIDLYKTYGDEFLRLLREVASTDKDAVNIAMQLDLKADDLRNAKDSEGRALFGESALKAVATSQQGNNSKSITSMASTATATSSSMRRSVEDMIGAGFTKNNAAFSAKVKSTDSSNSASMAVSYTKGKGYNLINALSAGTKAKSGGKIVTYSGLSEKDLIALDNGTKSLDDFKKKIKKTELNFATSSHIPTLAQKMVDADKHGYINQLKEYSGAIAAGLRDGNHLKLMTLFEALKSKSGQTGSYWADLITKYGGTAAGDFYLAKVPDGFGVYGSLLSNGKLAYNNTDLQRIKVLNPENWKNAKYGDISPNGLDVTSNLAVQKAFDGLNTRDKNAFLKEYRDILNKKKLDDAFPGITKFATGGLNDYTGLAMLHGTPSKPELVLNAKDTQNFLQLKDVLSHAMSGATTTNNSALAQYEININVDKIANDYDVERMTDQVIRKITQAGGYKKVTRGTFR